MTGQEGVDMIWWPPYITQEAGGADVHDMVSLHSDTNPGGNIRYRLIDDTCSLCLLQIVSRFQENMLLHEINYMRVCRTAHKCSDVRSYRAHRTTVPPGLWPGAPSGSSVPPLSARSDHHTRKVSRAGGCHRTGGRPLGVLISLQGVQTFKLDVVPTVPVVVRRQALVGWYNI